MTGAPKAWPRLPDPGLDLSGPKGPRSARYDDGYASAAGAAAETELVFLQAIGAPDVWRNRNTFSIGETGFGLGLNFLLTWAAWRETAPTAAQLHFVSVEGFPLTCDELGAALDPYLEVPGLRPLAQELVARYPVRHAGYHRLSLDDGRVKLTLLFGPVEDVLPTLSARMDAWYLDGFSPAKNPDMWSPAILRRIAERTRPGGAVATYTAAGAVRRGLTEAGFTMEKRPGFAGKRDRLVGVMADPPAPPTPSAPWFVYPEDGPARRSVAVIGAGIAGQWLNKALGERGMTVDLFDTAGPAGGMAGNPAALLVPKLHRQPTPAGQLHASAFLHALRSYDALPGPIWHEPRGARLALGDRDRAERTVGGLGWPEEVLSLDGSSDVPVQRFDRSGALDTDAVRAMLAASVRQEEVAGIATGDHAPWRLLDPDDDPLWEGDAVIVAAGGWSGLLLGAPWLNIRPSRGQVSFVRDGSAVAPEGSFSFDGYVTPALRLPDGSTGRILGSSFEELRRPDENDAWRIWSAQDHDRYADKFAVYFGGARPVADTGWVGLRATTPDRLPLAGMLPNRAAYLEDYPDLHQGKQWKAYPQARYRDGLYLLSGLGARGYQFAPLLAELLADQIAGTPLPLPTDLIDALHPGRFLIRDLIKNPY